MGIPANTDDAPMPAAESDGFRIFKPGAEPPAPAPDTDVLLGRQLAGAIAAIVRRETEAAVDDIVRDAVRKVLAEMAAK